MLSKLRDHGAAVEVEPKPSHWYGRLVFLLPLALLVVFWVLVVRRANATGAFATRMTRSRARRVDIDSPHAMSAFLGQAVNGRRDHSREAAAEIDDEIARIVTDALATARAVLLAHRDALDRPRPRSGRARVDRPRRVHRAARRRDACTLRRAKDAYFHACTG